MFACTAVAVALGGVAVADTSPTGTSSTFTNSAKTASGLTPSGVEVTVSKTMIGQTRVASAEATAANAAAPDDEYLVPANAKATAGFVDLYEGFTVNPGGWSDVATLTFTFSRPVRDPHLHVFGTGGSSGTSARNRDDYWPAVDLVSGAPAEPTFSKAAGFPGFRVTSASITPERVYTVSSTTCGVVYTCGTVKLNGTLTSFTIKLRARDVRYGDGGTTPQLWAAFKLSLAEDASDAPTSYGAATHAIGDSFLGRTVTADHPGTVSLTPRGMTADTDADDAVTGSPARIGGHGGSYTLAIPVTSGSLSNVTGWIDFDRDGRFDPNERATAQVAAGATTATLRWVTPRPIGSGPTWMRLRMSAASTGSATGWADSGEVEDHRISLDH
ncbi:hypothetical protein C1J01_09305 [Nonomuraea aridisoli]|uniref:GEVED domain-containing protein n=1 Tax=Nonomuraea aridisoli TaxID=2070368 RepID=A0A2W2EUF1_9ACTN|nr:hypothetical protein C1J01_09305 [Nonomuraea aridisoli]